MLHTDYINPEFISYLNRHCTGIMQLKDKIEKISVYYELAEAFSNRACRFYIDIDLFDYETLSDEDKRSANNYFYNSQNETGSKFVSFIYKSQRDYHMDAEVIKLFIYHYQFAQNIFDGFIKNVIPATCEIEIASLETEPFFNYISDFLRKSKYSQQNENSFKKEYLKVTKREFDFDCYYHSHLIDATVKELPNRENIVTDEDLYNAGGGDISAIRRFVIENKVPFSIGYYTDVIDNIQIDASVLKEKIMEYIPDEYSNIRSTVILNLIKNKEEAIFQKDRIIKEKSDMIAVRLGDYVYIENQYHRSSDSDIIGIIKSIHLDYSEELEIKYNTLKKDLSESGLPLKSASSKEIAYTLQSEIFQDEKNKGSLRTKDHLIRLFKSKGSKNPISKTKRK